MIPADGPARVNPEESHLTVLLDFSPKVGKGGGVEICNGQVVWEQNLCNWRKSITTVSKSVEGLEQIQIFHNVTTTVPSQGTQAVYRQEMPPGVHRA